MYKNIFNFNIALLTFLSLINLIYYGSDSFLSDNYYEISSIRNTSNLFYYYISSLTMNFIYWSGLWVVPVVFSLCLFKFFFSNEKQFKQLIFSASVSLLFICVFFLFFPRGLGEGLYSLVDSRISNSFGFFILLCQIALVLYLIVPNLFTKFFSFKYLNFKTSFLDFILSLNFKIVKSPPLSIPSFPRFTKNREPLIPKVKLSESVPDKTIPIDEPDVAQSELDNSLELDAESLPSALELESRFDEAFFDSNELIDCIAPKENLNKITDLDDQYFSSIASSIEEKLLQFNITAQVINVLKGPVVDTFELELGAGVKVTGVTNRTDDLSLALMGAPIRMVYPMKGKSTIGIEVPRNPREVIYLDEVLKSKEFNNSNFKLPVAMGKDAYGDPAIIDLASTPHLLVAGTTGAGKSVFVNTLLVSLVVRFSPKKLRLIMLDPKQLELALYQRLPHLIMPVVTDPQIASAALLWVIDEMEKRYSLLKDFGVKNIEGFNKKILSLEVEQLHKINKYYEDVKVENFELPYIVVVVDEFADLMLSKSGKAIESSISRLAAKARASGIHIVLATQRPSTDIITGVIKANFPTRVSFRVFTNIDSRVILDGVGAEKLLGKGDMLFKQGIDILRMHSAYVNEDEIETLVEKLATLPSQYDSAALEFIER